MQRYHSRGVFDGAQQTPGMEHRWERLKDWLEANAPAVTEALRPAATEAELDRAEADIGLTFPPSVRESYRVHDGQTTDSWGLFDGWRLLPLDDIVVEWQNQREIERRYEFGDWDPQTAIPLMEDGGGNFLYVEHAPDRMETPVIEWWHEQPTRDVQAASFAAYIEAFLEALEAGAYVYLQKDGALVHEDDL